MEFLSQKKSTELALECRPRRARPQKWFPISSLLFSLPSYPQSNLLHGLLLWFRIALFCLELHEKCRLAAKIATWQCSLVRTYYRLLYCLGLSGGLQSRCSSEIGSSQTFRCRRVSFQNRPSNTDYWYISRLYPRRRSNNTNKCSSHLAPLHFQFRVLWRYKFRKAWL